MRMGIRIGLSNVAGGEYLYSKKNLYQSHASQDGSIREWRFQQ
jgi:hypothetical protein